MTDSAILATELFFSFDANAVLQNVNLRIEKGEFIGIIGPNGGGKTTFLKLLMGFLKPSQGRLEVLGKTPFSSRLKIGYVPQIHQMDRDFPITVWELVLLGALHRTPHLGRLPIEIKEKAALLMKEFDLLPFCHRPFSSLSGGLAQRALFIRALLSEPDLLLLDEPTANVDAQSSQKILEKLDQFKGHKTILMITHDLRTITERVNRILTIQGRIQSFLPEEICEHFALGLYHAPLLGQPQNHFMKGAGRHECAPR